MNAEQKAAIDQLVQAVRSAQIARRGEPGVITTHGLARLLLILPEKRIGIGGSGNEAWSESLDENNIIQVGIGL